VNIFNDFGIFDQTYSDPLYFFVQSLKFFERGLSKHWAKLLLFALKKVVYGFTVLIIR